jgi:succinyl-diaminopimelate desuccinylase
MEFGHHILEYQEAILRDLAELVAIPSCAGDAQPNAPYGEKTAHALNWILTRARDFGLSTANVENAAGHAEYGEGQEIAAVLTHVDIVPPGEGWSSDPFCLTQRDGRLFGRGVADDKGAAVVALYCLKALKDHGVHGERRIRAIFGAGEEIASDDMERYFTREPLPTLGFTPDADYGICNREKGILRLELSDPRCGGTVLSALQAGTVPNAVPERAQAILRCDEEAARRLRRLAEAADTFAFPETAEGTAICAFGKAAHAMQPQKGKNAAAHLIRLLAECFERGALGGLCSFLDEAVGLETDGNSLGLCWRDAASGALTCNLGTVEIGTNGANAVLDIRYPVTADGDTVIKRVRRAAGQAGLKLRVMCHNPPLYVKEEESLVRILQEAYRAAGCGEASLYATGGGTYARALQGRGVAFGPVFPGEETHLHECDESISLQSYLRHAQICLEAMYRLMTAQLG